MTLATVITGIPGVGKSTVCRALAHCLPLAAHVEADTLHRFLVSGGQWPSAATATAIDQLLLRTRNAAAVTANFVAAGIPTYLDEVVCHPQQVAVLADLVPHARIVILTATDEVVLRRDTTRSKHTAANYLNLANDIADVVGEAATWVDTTALTTDQTLTAIMDSLS
jgi:broad-specificity NMP kinase